MKEIFEAISDNVEKIIRGKRDVIEQILLCLFSKGHVLIEDLPGVGKTLLAKAIAQSINTDFSRIQFTPDLLPSDVVGVSIWKPSDNDFHFMNGPIFSNVVLADEINRSSPKTQSALLEAMEENQVTVGGLTHKLPELFMVIATQNPIEAHGTYPLLESQMDRFLLVTEVGYPDYASEHEILVTHQTGDGLDDLEPVVDTGSVLTAIKSTADVFVSDPIRRYLLDIATETRNHPNLSVGMSTRVTLDLQRIAQTHAAVEDRDYVIPDDIQALVKPVISHRIYPIGSSSQTKDEILSEIMGKIPVPTVTKAMVQN